MFIIVVLSSNRVYVIAEAARRLVARVDATRDEGDVNIEVGIREAAFEILDCPVDVERPGSKSLVEGVKCSSVVRSHADLQAFRLSRAFRK